MIRRGLAAVAAAAILVGLILPLTALPASACDVSYGYKPSLSLNKPDLGRGEPCSTGTSLAGAFFVALLALGTVAAGAALAFRKGETTTRTSAPGPAAPAPALVTYLHAAGIAASAYPRPGGTRDPGIGV